jgi:circadian clock protein KaiC
LTSTGVPSLDSILGSDGYPDRSAILVVGAPGVGKEALGYWFTHSGLVQGDFCLYVTRLSTRQVLKDASAFGVDYSQRVPLWMATDGGQIKFDINDLAGLSFNIKETLKRNNDRRIRIVSDVLSPLLMLHPPDVIYRFLSQLFEEIRQRDVVFLASLEDGMHQPQVITAMQQLFDGVVELRIYEEGLRFVPILRIRKMLGVTPQPGYFNFSFTRTGMEISAHG